MNARMTPEGWVALGLAVACSVLVALDAGPGPVQAVLVLAFVTFGPGLALIHAVGRSRPVEAVPIVIAWSLASAVVVSLLVLATRSRADGLFVYGLALETLALVVWGLRDPESEVEDDFDDDDGRGEPFDSDRRRARP